MSSVSRSVYQKLAEENKRLKNDIEILILGNDMDIQQKVWDKYYLYFEKRNMYNKMIREILLKKL